MNTQPTELIQRLELDDLNKSPRGGVPLGLRMDLFKNVNVSVQVVAGEAELPISDVLAMKAGEVVALDTPADAPMSILLNGQVIARGELVAVGEYFGVRITEVAEGDTGL